MLQIKLHESYSYRKTICLICGGWFDLENVRAALWDGEEEITNVCPDCIKAGSDKFHHILKSHAQRLKRLAEDLEDLAKQTIKCPSYSEYEKFGEAIGTEIARAHCLDCHSDRKADKDCNSTCSLYHLRLWAYKWLMTRDKATPPTGLEN